MAGKALVYWASAMCQALCLALYMFPFAFHRELVMHEFLSNKICFLYEL